MRAVQAVPGSEEYQARIDELQDELGNYQANIEASISGYCCWE